MSRNASAEGGFPGRGILPVVDNEGMGDRGLEPVTSPVCKKLGQKKSPENKAEFFISSGLSAISGLRYFSTNLGLFRWVSIILGARWAQNQCRIDPAVNAKRKGKAMKLSNCQSASEWGADL
jgi:hypothetical protein